MGNAAELCARVGKQLAAGEDGWCAVWAAGVQLEDHRQRFLNDRAAGRPGPGVGASGGGVEGSSGHASLPADESGQLAGDSNYYRQLPEGQLPPLPSTLDTHLEQIEACYQQMWEQAGAALLGSTGASAANGTARSTGGRGRSTGARGRSAGANTPQPQPAAAAGAAVAARRAAALTAHVATPGSGGAVAPAAAATPQQAADSQQAKEEQEEEEEEQEADEGEEDVRNWVQCARCQTWRLVPDEFWPGIQSAGEEDWYCEVRCAALLCA